VVTSSVSRMSDRSSAGGTGRDGQHGGRAVDEDEARVQCARRGAQDLGQPGAGLDRVGDRGKRPEVGGA
jgi:hypothetical protein